MPPRYTVRAQPGSGYLIWDNETNRVATSSESREYVDLSFDEAFRAVDHLNLNPNKEE